MNYRAILFALTFSLASLVSLEASAATVVFDAHGSGNNWSTPTNWVGNAVPLTSDDVQINATCIFDAGANITTYGNLSFQATGSLTLNNASPLKVVNVSASSSATLSLSTGTLQVSGAVNFTNITFNADTGTVDYAGPGNQSVPANTYYNLSISGARTASSTISIASSSYVIKGAFTPIATGTGLQYFNIGATFTFDSNGAQTIPSGFRFCNITVIGNRGANIVNIAPGITALSGDFNVSGATFTSGNVIADVGNTVLYSNFGAPASQAIAPIIYYNLSAEQNNVPRTFAPFKTTEIKGDFTSTVSGPTFIAANAEILYSGTVTQNVLADILYDKLTLTNVGLKQAAGNITVNTQLLLQGASISIPNTKALTTGDFTGDATSNVIFEGFASSFFMNLTNSTNYMGAFTGSGSIFKAGPGNLTLSGNSPGYTGNFSFTGGASLTSPTALGGPTTPGTISFDMMSGLMLVNVNTPNLIMTVGGGTLVATGNSRCSLNVDSGGAIIVVESPDQLTMLLQGGGMGAPVFISDNGKVTLLDNPDQSGMSYFDGSLISTTGGTVQLEGPRALGKDTSVCVVGSNGTIVSHTPSPIPQAVVLDGATLGVTGGNGSFSGPIQIDSPSLFLMEDAFAPGTARSISISGALMTTNGNVTLFNPTGASATAPFPAVRFSGDATGFNTFVSVGPGTELEVLAPSAGFVNATVAVGPSAIFTASSPVLGGGSVHAQSGGLVRGLGTFGAAATANITGGIVSPGAQVPAGTLTFGQLTSDSDSKYFFDIGPDAASSDAIVCKSGMTLNGMINILPKPGLVFAPSYTLFSTTGSFIDSGIQLASNVPAVPGYTVSLSKTSKTVLLNFTPLPITLTAVTPVSGEVGKDFNYSFTATSASPLPIMVSNSALPPGLRLQGLSILGTPASKGSYAVTLTATNGAASASQVVNITINDPVKSNTFGPFAIEGRVGTALFIDFATYISADDIAKNTFVATGLPDGLKVAGSTISGIPKTAGSFTGTVDGFDKSSPTTKTGTATYTITILDKKATLGPVLTDLLIDPDQPGINELTLFAITATQSDNLPVTVTWDFGDGSATKTGTFVDHTYTTAGTYNVIITATSGSGATAKTTTLMNALTVAEVDPHAPVIVKVDQSPSPSTVNQLVTFTAATSDIDNDTITLDWTFGDGKSTFTGNPATFTYTAAGSYLVTVVATDSNGLKSRTTQFLQFVGKGSGETNDQQNSSKQSFDGITQSLDFSEDGLIGLTVIDNGTGDAFSRADMEVDTDFGFQGRRAVKGGKPAAQFTAATLTVAKSTVREVKTRKETGKARKTIGVSNRETKQPAVVDAEPSDKKMNAVKLSGSFFPSRNAQSGDSESRAALKGALPSDSVTASGTVTMPGGLDLTAGTEVQVALGNIIDKIVIDAKGGGKGRFTTLKMAIKTDKKTKKSVAEKAAKFSIKMSVAEMTTNGFDTEGVVVSKEQSGKALSIQCALLIGGVVYTQDSPVTLKVTPKEDKATMVTRRAN